MTERVFIFGFGYTGSYVGRSLEGRSGVVVGGTVRNPTPPPGLTSFDLTAGPTDLSFVPEGAKILYSIPELPAWMVEALTFRSPKRLVYLSSTGVYGRTRCVDETTPASPDRPEMQARLEAEQLVLSAPFSSMVLRPAAIYGSDRGIHRRLREGTFRGAGRGYISRIHVEDLAAVCIGALFSELGGAWPVADDHACPSSEIVQFCVEVLGLPGPVSDTPDALHPTLRGDRIVDGSAIRKYLSLGLKYPTYHRGIEAALRQETLRG